MKNLKAGIIALILTTVLFTSFGQTSANVNPVTGLVAAQITNVSPYIDISGKVINADSKHVSISLYILEDDCTWTEIESQRGNKYVFMLERDQEYQVWFHDTDASKILYIDAGYNGNMSCSININFESTMCMRLSPGPGAYYNQEIMSFDSMIPLIYQTGPILN